MNVVPFREHGGTGSFPMAEMVSCVVISKECSADMLKALRRANLRPDLFKIDKWEKV